MKDLSLHILDIAENAVRAGAKNIIIEVAQDKRKDELIVLIKDDGKGMDQKTQKQAVDPFFTTKDGKKIGLGLALFSQAAKQAGGDLKIKSAFGKGTQVKAVFKSSHPDTKPMGDITQTIAVLIAGNPSVRFVYTDKREGSKCHFDTLKNRDGSLNGYPILKRTVPKG